MSCVIILPLLDIILKVGMLIEEDFIMDSLFVSINAIFPIAILTAIGFYIKKRGILGETTFQELNKICFKLFLPVLLFCNIYTTDQGLWIPWKLMLFCVAMVLVVFFIMMVCTPIFVKDSKQQGVVIQGVFRSNFVILGFPIATAICAGQHIAIVSILAAVIVPLFNFLAVITLVVHGEDRINYKMLVVSILKNPLIISSAIGVTFYLLQITLPTFLVSTIKSVSYVATPLSIIVLGGSLNIFSIKNNRKILFGTIFFRLLVVPLAVVSVAIALGFRNIELVTILTVFATPTAVSSYVMAREMNCDGELAAEIVILSSIISCFTIFIFIYFLDAFAFL